MARRYTISSPICARTRTWTRAKVFSGPAREHALRVDFPPDLLSRIPEGLRAGLLEALRQDPRPSYQEDPSRLYGMPFAGQDVRFTVEGDVLTVREIGAIPGPPIQGV